MSKALIFFAGVLVGFVLCLAVLLGAFIYLNATEDLHPSGIDENNQ